MNNEDYLNPAPAGLFISALDRATATFTAMTTSHERSGLSAARNADEAE